MPSKVRVKARWVVKAGSQMVCEGGPLLIRDWMRQVSVLREKFGIEVVWVTSGAIATAVDRMHFKSKTRSLSQKQALSAIGQPVVMDLYNIAIQATGQMGAQVLLTGDDLKNPNRRKNFQATIDELLRWSCVPVLNENDAVANEEIRFGDNDNLSAQVAQAIGADRLVLLTDVEGLYTKNPKEKSKFGDEPRFISTLDSIPPKLLEALRSSSKSQRGTGGMYSKLLAAKFALKNRIATVLAKGDLPSVLVKLARGEKLGTYFPAQKVKNK